MFFKPTAPTILFDEMRGDHHVVIRYLCQADVKELHRYINELSQERTYITFQGDTISMEEEKKHVADVMRAIEAKREVKLVMEVDGQLCGVCEVIREDRVTAHRGNLGLSISKRVRGMGLGELLIRSLIDEAARVLPNLRIIKLTCFASNAVAQSLYKKVGFVQCGRVPDAIYYNGAYEDEIILCLDLT